MQQLNPSEISDIIKRRIESLDVRAEAQNEGTIVGVSDGIVRVHGLAEAKYGEMIEFTAGLALIPVVNVAMVAREAIAGTFHWPLIGITLAVEALCVLLALRAAVAILRYEDFLVGSYGGSFGRFLRERLLGGRRRGRQ